MKTDYRVTTLIFLGALLAYATCYGSTQEVAETTPVALCDTIVFRIDGADGGEQMHNHTERV